MKGQINIKVKKQGSPNDFTATLSSGYVKTEVFT